MSASRLAGMAAVAIAAFTASNSSADDNVRLLAGTGSIRGTSAASTKTLERNAAEKADTLPACFGWRRWGYSYYAPVRPPVVAYAAPAYYPPSIYSAPMTAPPPAAGPATYYYPPVQSPEPITTAPTPRPAIVVGYQGRFFGGSIVIRPAARLARPTERAPQPSDFAPPPQPDGRYRYDGGPARPVPMPLPDPVDPTDPVPATVPALQRVRFERSRQNVKYPGFGERPAAKTAAEPILVKRSAP
jgi:hypothetical protein